MAKSLHLWSPYTGPRFSIGVGVYRDSEGLRSVIATAHATCGDPVLTGHNVQISRIENEKGQQFRLLSPAPCMMSVFRLFSARRGGDQVQQVQTTARQKQVGTLVTNDQIRGREGRDKDKPSSPCALRTRVAQGMETAAYPTKAGSPTAGSRTSCSLGLPLVILVSSGASCSGDGRRSPRDIMSFGKSKQDLRRSD